MDFYRTGTYYVARSTVCSSFVLIRFACALLHSTGKLVIHADIPMNKLAEELKFWKVEWDQVERGEVTRMSTQKKTRLETNTTAVAS